MTPLRVAAAVTLLGLVLLAPGAAAHANYLSSQPPQGARLDEAPTQVVITLSEPVDPAGVTVTVRNADGDRVDHDDLRVQSGNTPRLTITLQDVGPGAYRATWKALSTVDGHVTQGTVGFAVGGFEPPVASSNAERALSPTAPVARFLLYVGFALAIGGLVAAWHVETRPRPFERSRFLAKVVIAGAALQSLGVALLAWTTWRESGLEVASFIADSAVGRTMGVRLSLAVLGLAAAVPWAIRALDRDWRGLVLLALFLGGALGASSLGHVSVEGTWAVGLDWLHLLAAATWLGGLGLFLHFVATAPGRGDTMESVRVVGFRFSRIALTSVVLLGLTGLITAVLIVGWAALLPPWGLLSNEYGLFLAGKIALFGGMVLLAGINRFVFLGERPGPDTRAPGQPPEVTAPADLRGGHGRTRQFARVVAVEAALGIGVLVLAGFLTAVSPLYTVDEAGPGLSEFLGTGIGDHFDVGLSATPNPTAGGSSNVSVTIGTSDGEPLTEAIRVRVEVRAGDEGGGAAYNAYHEGDGVWVLGEVLWTTAGNHTAFVTIQTEDVYREVIEVDFTVEE